VRSEAALNTSVVYLRCTFYQSLFLGVFVITKRSLTHVQKNINCLKTDPLFLSKVGANMALEYKLLLVALLVGAAAAGDINRQAIVFYPETPDVFYCPQEKPISLVTNSFLG
jgi:hypothetical protein